MATIKELINDVNTYLNPNIDQYSSKDLKTYKINGTWIDLIEDKYFSTESLFLLQKIENTILKSDQPILLITRLHHVFNKRLFELNQYRKTKLNKHLKDKHRLSLVDFNESVLRENYKKQCKKIITSEVINAETNPESELYTLKSFLNLPYMLKIHRTEDIEGKKLLFHLDRFVEEASKVFMVLDEILYDYENFKMVIYDDYFKTYYKTNSRKIQVDLKLKDLAYFYYFALEMGFFKFHPERKMNKKLMVDFFENNFMYTDYKSGSMKEFQSFEKHLSDAARENNRFKNAFINTMLKKLEEFKKINLTSVERYSFN